MAQWILPLAIVAAALVCPAVMWLGRRGIGPGCALCPPRRSHGDSLEELRARQRTLAARIEDLEAAQHAPAVTADGPARPE